MSIFIRNLKLIFEEELKNLGKSAAVNDGSIINKFATVIGLGRNPAITEAKAQIISKLLINIKNVSEEISDEEAANQISKLCTQAILDEKESTKGVAGSGHFGERMSKIGILPNVLLAEVQNYPILLNCNYSQDPLGSLKYHAACYLMQRTASSHLYPNAIIPAEWGVSNDKKTALKESLDECIHRISLLDKTNPEYPQEIFRHVVETVKLIQTRNQQLIKANSVNLLVTTFHAHGLGFLDVCMKAVLKDIERYQKTASPRTKVAAAERRGSLDPDPAPAPAPAPAPDSDSEIGSEQATQTGAREERSPLTIHRKISPPPSPDGNAAPKRHSSPPPTFFQHAQVAEAVVPQQEVDTINPTHSAAAAAESPKTAFPVVYFPPAPLRKGHTKAARRKAALEAGNVTTGKSL